MNVNELRTKTVKELRDIAKGLDIKGRWDMTKEQLVDAIYVANLNDSMIELETDCIMDSNNKNASEGSHNVTKTTEDYLKTVKPGTFVAFKRNKNKEVAMSGKFVSFDGNKVVIESKRGTLFKVDKQNIVWVKTGSRWPKWVFSLFNNKIVEEADDNAIS